MARFTSNKWALVSFFNESVVATSDNSQDLFTKVGLRRGDGKLSLKQAVYKQHQQGDGEKIVSIKDGIIYSFERLYDIGKSQSEYDVLQYQVSDMQWIADAFDGAKEEQKQEVKSPKTERDMGTTPKGQQTAEQLLAQAMRMLGGGAVDTAEVEKIVKEQIRIATLPKVVTIEVKLPKREEVIKLGRQHYLFNDVLESVADNDYVMLVGEAGSGKTYGAVQVAKALELDYRIFSFTNEISLGRCIGYMDAMGKYVTTSIREMYENGGLLILDEFDAMNPNVAVSLNNMLSGDEYVFPDKVVAKHKDFRVIACTNTFGKGADKDYSARQKLDMATLDRFDAKYEWGYDEDLEKAIFGDTEATRVVFAIRKNARNIGITITPRRTKAVNKMVARGVSLKDAVQRAILCDYKKDQQRALVDGVSL